MGSNDTQKRKHPRKPKPYGTGMAAAFVKFTNEYGFQIETDSDELDAKDARRFARWLLRAADYIEARNG